jgi:hypothetical protein
MAKMIIGQAEWGLGNQDAGTVIKHVEAALENGSVAQLELYNSSGARVIGLVNGKVTPIVVFDLDGNPRPTEMS